MLHLFWKRDGATGCYTKYLERLPLEEREDDLVQYFLAKASLFGACECLIKWQPVPEDSPLQPSLFGNENIYLSLYPLYRRLIKKMRPFDCQCPDIDLIGSKRDSKRDVITTTFCLKRHSQISRRVSHNSADVTRSRCFLLKKVIL